MQYLQKAELQSADRGVCQQIGEGSKREEVVQVKVRRVLPAKRRVGQRPGGIEELTGAEAAGETFFTVRAAQVM